MSETGPNPEASPAGPATGPTGPTGPTGSAGDPAGRTTGGEPAAVDTAREAAAPAEQKPGAGHDPLRGSRTSGLWTAVVALIVLLVLLAVFVFQNTQQVRVTYFGWDVQAPLSAALLVATAAGGLIVVAAGSLRILQLRRRVRRESKLRRGSRR